MLYFIIAFFLALVPFLVWPDLGDGIRTPKEIASIIGFIAIISTALYNYRLKPFKNKWLLLFLLWCFLTTIFNSYGLPRLFGYADGDIHLFEGQLENGSILATPINIFAWKELFYITLSIFTIFTISSVDFIEARTLKFKSFILSFKSLDHKELIRNIANVITIILIVMSVYAIIQAIGLDNFFRASNPAIDHTAPFNTDSRWHFTHRIVGTIGNPSIFSTWIAIVLPFSLYLKRWRGYIAFLLGVIAIALAYSSTSIIAAFIGILFYFFMQYPKIITIMILVGIILFSACAIFFPIKAKIENKLKDFFDTTGRLEVYKETWKILRQRPLLGMGLGSFEYLIGINPNIVKKLNDENWREMHNEYGQIWFTTGLIGLMLFMMFLFSVVWMFFKNITNESIVLASSLLVLSVIALTLFPFRIAPTSFYGAIETGLLMNITRRD